MVSSPKRSPRYEIFKPILTTKLKTFADAKIKIILKQDSYFDTFLETRTKRLKSNMYIDSLWRISCLTKMSHIWDTFLVRATLKIYICFFFLVFSNISKPTESEEENAKQRNVILTVQNKVVSYYQSLEKIF